MPKLADTRTMTMADAEAVLEQLAHLACTVAKADAATEARIAKLKSVHAETVAAPCGEMAAMAVQLSEFILGNPDAFKRSRARKTSFGKFGRRTVSNVKVVDKDNVLAWAMGHGAFDVLEQRAVLKLAALRKRLADGEAIPGATLLVGEEAFYKIDKALLDAAVEQG